MALCDIPDDLVPEVMAHVRRVVTERLRHDTWQGTARPGKALAIYVYHQNGVEVNLGLGHSARLTEQEVNALLLPPISASDVIDTALAGKHIETMAELIGFLVIDAGAVLAGTK